MVIFYLTCKQKTSMEKIFYPPPLDLLYIGYDKRDFKIGQGSSFNFLFSAIISRTTSYERVRKEIQDKVLHFS